jgi:hypothetical protein
MDIVIDFDGTCVSHEFPNIGKDIGSVRILKQIIESKHNLILFTMRCDKKEPPKYLSDAVEWFKNNNIPLYGIQSNPSQHYWADSPKALGDIYIDDAALGCPLKFDKNISDHPFVDWGKVEEMLINLNII